MENEDDRPPGQSDRHGVGQEEKEGQEGDEGHPGGQPPLHHPLEIKQSVQPLSAIQVLSDITDWYKLARH